jgi:hypothetical protein
MISVSAPQDLGFTQAKHFIFDYQEEVRQMWLARVKAAKAAKIETFASEEDLNASIILCAKKNHRCKERDNCFCYCHKKTTSTSSCENNRQTTVAARYYNYNGSDVRAWEVV